MNIHAAAQSSIANLNGANKQTPAQLARTAVSDQPALADQSFGKLVSDFARENSLRASPVPDVES